MLSRCGGTLLYAEYCIMGFVGTNPSFLGWSLGLVSFVEATIGRVIGSSLSSSLILILIFVFSLQVVSNGRMLSHNILVMTSFG